MENVLNGEPLQHICTAYISDHIKRWKSANFGTVSAAW